MGRSAFLMGLCQQPHYGAFLCSHIQAQMRTLALTLVQA